MSLLKMLQYSSTFAAFMIFPCAEERNFPDPDHCFAHFKLNPPREKMPKRKGQRPQPAMSNGERELCVTN